MSAATRVLILAASLAAQGPAAPTVRAPPASEASPAAIAGAPARPESPPTPAPQGDEAPRAGAGAEESTERAEADEADEADAEDPEAARAWYRDVHLLLFADAFGSVNYNFPTRPVGANVAHGNSWSTGFGFVWAGLDLQYARGPVGGTIGLRFGPASELYNGADTDYGLQYIKQAYASFAPRKLDGALTVDFGKFDTLYGAEVADSFLNLNYTRGVLVWIEQPFFHTGLRVRYAPADWFAFTLIAVNGWNRTLENNRGKTFGIQPAFSSADGRFSLALGYLTGPENDETVTIACADDTAFSELDASCVDAPGTPGAEHELDRPLANSIWRHFVDLVLTARPGERWTIVLNADYTHDQLILNPVTGALAPVQMYGIMAGAQLRVAPRWAVAARGEFVHDINNTWTAYLQGPAQDFDEIMLGTGTITLRYEPFPSLILMLDNRLDGANAPLFNHDLEVHVRNTQFTTTLGVIVKTP
ncbi:MAG: outer membrane beta-barrel protein [Myxococcales bacterium]|nr:outer membrane beta-barrel protein [Myxococcales bacterium]